MEGSLFSYLIVAFLLVGCTRASRDSVSSPLIHLNGQIAHSLSASSVVVYALDDGGSPGKMICQSGISAPSFDCAVPADPDSEEVGPIVVVASDVQGNQFHAIGIDPATNASVNVSSVSEIGFQRMQALVSQGVLLAHAAAVADSELRLATGLTGGEAIAALAPAVPPVDPGAREANARGALETALIRLAAALGVSPGALAIGLGSDFAFDRCFDGRRVGAAIALSGGTFLPADIWRQLQATFDTLAASDPHYGAEYVYALKLLNAPPPLPAEFEVTGPIISVSPPFSITWSSGLASSYAVTLCTTPDFTDAATCRAVHGLTALTTDPGAFGALLPGTYYVKVTTDDGRSAVNASDRAPYSFQLLSGGR